MKFQLVRCDGDRGFPLTLAIDSQASKFVKLGLFNVHFSLRIERTESNFVVVHRGVQCRAIVPNRSYFPNLLNLHEFVCGCCDLFFGCAMGEGRTIGDNRSTLCAQSLLCANADFTKIWLWLL